VAAWGDTLLALPNATPSRRYRDIFTDRTYVVTERDGVVGLPLAALLEHFPVALLERIENEPAVRESASESVFEYNGRDA
jgi:maltooligosyltrehalose synthase